MYICLNSSPALLKECRKVFINGTITTISTSVKIPYGVAVNSMDEIFIADTGNLRIMKIDGNGVERVIAGGGSSVADGSLATQVKLREPWGLAFNKEGEVHIADHNITKLTACPSMSTRSGYYCNCTEGYYGYGQYCNMYNCSNYFYNSASVCSSRGACVAPNTCSCETGYYGANCELFNCSGIPFDKPHVCSGYGSCSDYNKCSCNSGYYGFTCDGYNCNGLLFNDTTVCSSRGKCIAPNNCTCPQGYYGANCELYNCFGIVNTNKRACSGIGDCVLPDQCECPTSNSITYNKDCSQQGANETNSSIVKSTDQTGVLVGAIVPSVIVVLAIICVLIVIIIVLVVRSKRSNNQLLTEIPNPSLYEMKSFTNSNLISDFPSQYSTSSKISQSADPMDRYTDLIKIGQGGFGSVYKGRDSKSGNEIKAIKVIRFDNNDDLNMAMREGIQLLKMNHPNVLKVNDFFIGNGQILCIDMVYYENGDLNTFLGGSTYCSERIVAQILKQSCSALDYIFKNFGIIHRDIKPSNIFVQKLDKSNIEIVIADFGLAKNTKLSTSVSFAGTPMYISPELLCGINADHKTDIFSLGVTLFQIMSHDTNTSINQLYMLKDYESVMQILRSKINSQYSADLINIALRMLEKDPEKRIDANSILKLPY